MLILISLLFVFILALVWFYYAYVIETKLYQTHKLVVDLTFQATNLNILHISDLHLCSPESHKINFLKNISDNDLDLVFLTGDVFENYSGLPYICQILSRTPKIGAYAVLGNHDYYDYRWINKTIGKIIKRLKHPTQRRDVSSMIEALQNANFKVLRNEVEVIDKYKIGIIGIDYPTVEYQKLESLVKQIPDDYLKLVLFHIPLNLQNMVKLGVNIAFGGHTHGGQIKLPYIGAVFTDSELPRDKASGLFNYEQTYFHVSNGAGADPKTNIRFLCPPSATILEVRSKESLKCQAKLYNIVQE